MGRYRFGFNGKETDEETGLQDYGFRIYHPAISKFLSVDPLAPDYPWYTPYTSLQEILLLGKPECKGS
jgi:RHS repeat-associated protein